MIATGFQFAEVPRCGLASAPSTNIRPVARRRSRRPTLVDGALVTKATRFTVTNPASTEGFKPLRAAVSWALVHVPSRLGLDARSCGTSTSIGPTAAVAASAQAWCRRSSRSRARTLPHHLWLGTTLPRHLWLETQKRPPPPCSSATSGDTTPLVRTNEDSAPIAESGTALVGRSVPKSAIGRPGGRRDKSYDVRARLTGDVVFNGPNLRCPKVTPTSPFESPSTPRPASGFRWPVP